MLTDFSIRRCKPGIGGCSIPAIHTEKQGTYTVSVLLSSDLRNAVEHDRPRGRLMNLVNENWEKSTDLVQNQRKGAKQRLQTILVDWWILEPEFPVLYIPRDQFSWRTQGIFQTRSGPSFTIGSRRSAWWGAERVGHAYYRGGHKEANHDQ